MNKNDIVNLETTLRSYANAIKVLATNAAKADNFLATKLNKLSTSHIETADYIKSRLSKNNG